MKHMHARVTLAVASLGLMALGVSQSSSSLLSEAERQQVAREGQRVLKVFGFEDPKTPFIGLMGSTRNKVSLEFDGATIFVDRLSVQVTYASLDKFRQAVTLRSPGQSLIRRSDAGWSTEARRKVGQIWPGIQLEFRNATRFPESSSSSIGRMSPNSNSISLEYRGTLGSRRVRVDVVFDQVTGTLVTVRLVDEPKPR